MGIESIMPPSMKSVVSQVGFSPTSHGLVPCAYLFSYRLKVVSVVGFEPTLFFAPNEVPYQARRHTVIKWSLVVESNHRLSVTRAE